MPASPPAPPFTDPAKSVGDLERELEELEQAERDLRLKGKPPRAHKARQEPLGLANRVERFFNRPPAKPRRRGGPPNGWRVRFLQGLAATGNVTHSARRAGVSRGHVINLRDKEPEFKQAWENALAEFADGLERIAVRLATIGTLEPVVNGGEIVTYKRKYYPQLIMAQLKRLRPAEYAERTEVRHLGATSPADTALAALLTSPALAEARVEIERIVVTAVTAEVAANAGRPALPEPGPVPPALPPE
jgi:hypothetical protein